MNLHLLHSVHFCGSCTLHLIPKVLHLIHLNPSCVNCTVHLLHNTLYAPNPADNTSYLWKYIHLLLLLNYIYKTMRNVRSTNTVISTSYFVHIWLLAYLLLLSTSSMRILPCRLFWKDYPCIDAMIKMYCVSVRIWYMYIVQMYTSMCMIHTHTIQHSYGVDRCQ